jgi:flagellar biosynthesis/type III secretory pathway chaperone
MEISLFRQQLGDQFSNAIDLLAGLEHLLFLEQEALSQRDPAEIKRVTDEKSALLKLLEGVYHAINQLLKARNHVAGSDGLIHCIDTPELEQLWGRLRSHLNNCNHQNQVNGGVIEVSRAYAERLFRILRGEKQRPALYNPHGRLQSHSETQAIAQA